MENARPDETKITVDTCKIHITKTTVDAGKDAKFQPKAKVIDQMST